MGLRRQQRVEGLRVVEVLHEVAFCRHDHQIILGGSFRKCLIQTKDW